MDPLLSYLSFMWHFIGLYDNSYHGWCCDVSVVNLNCSACERHTVVIGIFSSRCMLRGDRHIKPSRVTCQNCQEKWKNILTNTASLVSCAQSNRLYCLPWGEKHFLALLHLHGAASGITEKTRHLMFWRREAKTTTLYCIRSWWVRRKFPLLGMKSHHKSSAQLGKRILQYYSSM